MRHALRFWTRDELGVTAVEYGLIAGIFVTALIASFTVFGQSMVTMTEDVREHLVEAAPEPP